MITIPMLLFFFIAAVTFMCLLVLFFLSPAHSRTWYALILAGQIVWTTLLYRPSWFDAPLLFYLLPLAEIALLLRFGLAGISMRQFPTMRGEPRVTQEQLRGPTGTREALTLYFTLAAIGLIGILLVLFRSFHP
jgi:hypothetical protein